MECNKEEAVRAMQLSETKMQKHDFVGAMKMAQKAQQLFPELENISQLLAVCEVHCSAGNKVGGSEMDWYRILQIKEHDNEATIKKQYRKFALLLHPDKNKFAGAEAAFKLICEGNRVLADQAKRSIYDAKCRALKRTGGPNGDIFVRKHHDAASKAQNIPQSQYSTLNQHQQVQKDTFWTCCPFCGIKYQYYKDFANRLLRCQRCRRPFIAHELGIQGVCPESLRNQFPNCTEPPSQGPSKVGSFVDVGGVSKTEKQDVGHGFGVGKVGVEMFKSGSVKSKDSGTSRNTNNRRGRSSVFESGESCKTGSTAKADSEHVIQEKVGNPSELNGGHHHRRSSRKRQGLSSNENSDDVDDFMSPPKRSKESQFSSATEKERKNAAVDGVVSKNDRSTDSAAASVDGHKKEAKQKVSASLDENLPSKKSKTGEFELKVKEAAMPDNNESKSKADGGSGPKSNDASLPKVVMVPDPEFNKFVLDENRLQSIFNANQIWALYDPLDGMPRFYACVKKVFRPGFKLKITWLEPNPVDQGEIDWHNKELPVACGKFKLGHTDEITDHLVFSHQMHCTKGSGRSSFLVYPRKGETWAVFQNWDIGWSSEPKKHKPYKFEYVEVLSDFRESIGIGVAYLGKVKGFVSLFERTEQHGVVQFQVPPNELYRFSHQIPSFKMTGDEGYGVPEGSFEFDPASFEFDHASLPTNLDESSDRGDLKMDKRSMNSETNGLSCEFLESEPKPVMGSGGTRTSKKQEKNYSERESSVPRSPRNSNSKFVKSVKLEARQCVTIDNGLKNINLGDHIEPSGSATPFQADESINTPKKHQNTDFERENFRLRRSPRDLRKDNTRENVSMKHPISANNDNHARFTQSKINSFFSQFDDRMSDQHSISSMKSPVAPPSSSPACRLSQTQFYDFTVQKSEEKFQLGQIWALYSDRSGMPNTYAQVKKIELRPNFQLHMAFLEPCSEPRNKFEPVCCGTFKVKNGQTKVFSRTSFSHCLKAKPVGKKIFEINPRKGEVWALYKNPNPEMSCPKPGKGECEIVEVLEDNDLSTKVLVLTQLNGFKSVFKAPRTQRSRSGVIDIPRAELGRFSHQIPAFQHTGESDSRLAGCWELDPSSIPGIIICVV